MSKSGASYTKVAEIKGPLLVVDEVIPEFEICDRRFFTLIGF